MLAYILALPTLQGKNHLYLKEVFQPISEALKIGDTLIWSASPPEEGLGWTDGELVLGKLPGQEHTALPVGVGGDVKTFLARLLSKKCRGIGIALSSSASASCK